MIKYFTDFENKYNATKDFEITNDWYKNELGVQSFVSKSKSLDTKGNKSEEYIRARFVYSLISSGKYPRENICVEAQFPKGNNAKSINPDIVIFDNSDWFDILTQETSNSKGFSKLKNNILFIFEAKKNGKLNIAQIISDQLFIAMSEYEHKKQSNFRKNEVYGCYFDDLESVLIFKKESNYTPTRYYENKILTSNSNDLNISNRDFFDDLPCFNNLGKNDSLNIFDYTYKDLNVLSADEFNNILKSFNRIRDSLGINPVTASKYLIEFLAIKIYEEKNIKSNNNKIKYYYVENDKNFRNRIFNLQQESQKSFPNIYKNKIFNYEQKDNNIILKNESNIETFFIETIKLFQHYSILKGNSSSFNQIIFNNFNSMSDKAENKQFFTPIPIIDLIINLTKPKTKEFICDPTSGICDFLAMTFKQLSQLENNSFGENLFGFDIDEDAIKLANLNLLFNGDGASQIFKVKNSLTSKLIKERTSFIEDKDFTTDNYSIENWDSKGENSKEIFKGFDLIMTNPPFGKGRDLKCDYKKGGDNAVLPENTLKLYETYWFKNNPCYINGKFRSIKDLQEDLTKNKKELEKLDRKEITFPNSMDLGVLFLENAVKLLKDGGRMAIVISSSIASIQEWENVRQWFMSKMRIVGIIDLPSSIFAETGVATTIIMAYKPKNKDILKENYKVFTKEIINTGYDVKTQDRIVNFIPQYKINEETFETICDLNGNPIINEDMTETIIDFEKWKKFQENELREVF